MFALQICNPIISLFLEKLADDRIANLQCRHRQMSISRVLHNRVANVQCDHQQVFGKKLADDPVALFI